MMMITFTFISSTVKYENLTKINFLSCAHPEIFAPLNVHYSMAVIFYFYLSRKFFWLVIPNTAISSAESWWAGKDICITCQTIYQHSHVECVYAIPFSYLPPRQIKWCKNTSIAITAKLNVVSKLYFHQKMRKNFLRRFESLNVNICPYLVK